MVQPQKDAGKLLPLLRSDLEIYKGPDDSDGSTTYNIFDPMRQEYFKISWAEATLLQELKSGMTLTDLKSALDKNTTLLVSEDEILSFFHQAERQKLLQNYRESGKLEEEAKNVKLGFFKWTMFNYLFLKIPLINPNDFLKRTLHYAAPFMTPAAFVVYLFISMWGFLLLISRWDEFLYTVTYFFNMQGIVAYATAIIATKVIHEFSHAYVGKKYGLNIPTMGIALLVLWPVMYTDATDAWRLHEKKKRLLISAAGIIAELVLAGLATVGWAFTAPGILNSVFYVIASANWITTLAINLNPALRFDGYYIMSDCMGVENLQSRAFALARREGYRLLLGITLPHPEPRMPLAKQRILVIYSVYTWIYRLFLYTAIALFVYFKFTKALGIFLFFVEIGIFFIWPVAHEAQFFFHHRDKFFWNIRSRISATVAALMILWFVIPWPHDITAVAITVPVDTQIVYSPMNGEITKIFVDRGETVKLGQELIQLKSKEVESKVVELKLEIVILETKLSIIKESEELLSMYLETQEKLHQAQAELEGYIELNNLNVVHATVSGRIFEWDQLLLTGQMIEKDRQLGQIASAEALDAISYVPEEDVETLKVGQEVVLRIRSSLKWIPGKIKRIPPLRASILQHGQLASTNGGDLAVVGQGENPLTLIGSYYPILVELEARDDLPIGVVGDITYRGPLRSKLGMLAKFVISVFIQESGF